MTAQPRSDLVLAQALATDPTSASKARAAVLRSFAGLPEEVVEDAQLLVSEAVSDAAVRTSGQTPDEPPRLSGYLVDGTIRIEIGQDGRRRVAEAAEDDHLGLRILDHVASRWGHEHLGSSSTTWFEIDLVDPR
jgi:hypothetical protein